MSDSPEKIRFRCPSCAVKLAAPPRRAGAQIGCPKCKEKITIPSADAPPPAAGPAKQDPDASETRREWALARCPECDEVIKLRRVNLGSDVRCPGCDAGLVIEESETAEA